MLTFLGDRLAFLGDPLTFLGDGAPFVPEGRLGFSVSYARATLAAGGGAEAGQTAPVQPSADIQPVRRGVSIRYKRSSITVREA